MPDKEKKFSCGRKSSYQGSRDKHDINFVGAHVQDKKSFVESLVLNTWQV